MKKLKSISPVLFALALSFGFISKASAQLPGNISVPGKAANMESSVQSKVQQMKEKLNLNKDQVTKITNIYNQAEEKIANLKQRGVDPQQLLSQSKFINKSSDSKVNALLTPEQQTKFNALKAKL